MSLVYREVTSAIRGLIRFLCRVDDGQVALIPAQGPLILVINHINFLDPPLFFTHLQPRPQSGFAKAETWSNPALRLLADLWGAIPLHRGEADMAALRLGLKALEEGRILGVAPEGTRSGNGHMRRGLPGVTFLALHSRAPLLPVAHYGGEAFWDNLRRLRRTDVRIVVGRPFRLQAEGVRVTREVRQQMTDEVMLQVAALLPPQYRGVYAGGPRTQTYLKPL